MHLKYDMPNPKVLAVAVDAPVDFETWKLIHTPPVM